MDEGASSDLEYNSGQRLRAYVEEETELKAQHPLTFHREGTD